jgi:Niemann-Pick C1 protein
MTRRSKQARTLICAGHRLCCSGRQAAVMQSSLRMAEPFILGCPACLQNFRNLFCTLFCSPDQATFTNVTAVQKAAPAGSHIAFSNAAA